MLETRAFSAESIRNDFPILMQPLSKGRRLVYLDSGSSAQKPQCVIDKEVEVYRDHYANAYRGVYEFGNKVDEELESTRELVKSWINAKSTSEIVFTSGTTMSLNIIARGWVGKFLQAGDEILLNPCEHHANLVPWQMIAAETGASIKHLPLTNTGELDPITFAEYFTDKTKVVSVTGMSNVLGTLPPLKLMADYAKQVGAIFVVDGAQLVPHGKVDVENLGIDFLVFSGHKVYGPSGVGVLYGKYELLEAMNPVLGGGHMIDRVYLDHSTWSAPPAKFEAGTLPIAQAIALGTALEYLHSLDDHQLHAHEVELTKYAYETLQTVPGITIYGPPADRRGPIISFTIKGAHPEDLAQLLNKHGIFVRHGHHCTMPLHDLLGVTATIRASFGMYNTKADVDALRDALISALQRLRVI